MGGRGEVSRLLVVTTDPQFATLIRRHPRITVLFDAQRGTGERAVHVAERPSETGSVAKLLLTYRETAEALGLSERKVKNLVAEHQLPAVSIGAARRIRTVDV